MKVTIVGSGCGIPNPRRGSPCIAVSAGKHLFGFDCGPGAVRAMASFGLDWTRLDALFITHFHTDHIGDIPALLFAYNIPDTNRTAPLTLFGPSGMKKLFQNLVVAYGEWLVPKRYELSIEELPAVPFTGDRTGEATWRLETVPAEHSQPAFAYRFEADGASIVYSGDTDYSDSIAGLASSCDLLILECSYPNEIEAPGHLNPRKASEMAREAGCKKLALTHIYPVSAGYDLVAQCRDIFDGDVVVAEDGMRFELGGFVS
ncbi:MBL fold metallo-hydrolase [Candidatus Poribacteria bacterium]|nr:MBL fold metallo-hydrolase [Candidatus Poribacteria bacterium]